MKVGDLVEWKIQSVAGLLKCIGLVSELCKQVTTTGHVQHFVKLRLPYDAYRETTWLSAQDCYMLSKIKKGD
tara:strand:- start:377 stop:592 length:216 start_codon:yes stop_codon:yes gene_type:complete